MTLADGLTAIAAAAGLVLLAGLAFGQYRRGVIAELRASLETAQTEIGIERGRADRLEKQARQLGTEVAALRAEVATLRSVLTDQQALAKLVVTELSSSDVATSRTQQAVEDVKEAIGMQTATLLEAIRGQKATE